MLEMFRYELMQHALIAGVIIGLISPLVGVHLVVRRLSLIAEALSHVTFSGVAAGLLLQKKLSFFQMVNPIYMGMTFSVIGSLFVERIRRFYLSYQELAIPILLSAGIALGVIFISIGGGFNVDIGGYLFGSNILTVGKQELVTICITGVIVLLFLFLFYKELFVLSFDEEQAALSGVPKQLIHFFFIIIVAFVISAGIQVVGILLVSALMTIPVAASLQIAKSFKETMIWSVVFSQFAVISGLFAAFYLDWASGGTIVLVSILILILIVAGKHSFFYFNAKKRWREKDEY